MPLLPSRHCSFCICVAGFAVTLASTDAPAADKGQKPPLPSAEKLTQRFNEIYENAGWARASDGRGTSGSGSTVEITTQYRAYLEEFIKTHKVRSVVDAGCGDWGFSSTIDWNHTRYLGIDISTKVIEAVKKKHETKDVQFKVGDVTESLPSADLLICKDVLQHLPLALIGKFIKNNLRKGKYKWAIITNDRGAENQDVEPGNYRSINLSLPPFNMKRLVDLPIHFKDQDIKTAQLLDLRR